MVKGQIIATEDFGQMLSLDDQGHSLRDYELLKKQKNVTGKAEIQMKNFTKALKIQVKGDVKDLTKLFVKKESEKLESNPYLMSADDIYFVMSGEFVAVQTLFIENKA